jgi:hypothetical protein
MGQSLDILPRRDSDGASRTGILYAVGARLLVSRPAAFDLTDPGRGTMHGLAVPAHVAGLLDRCLI